FINGVLKTLIANEQLDRAFIDRHTAAFGALKESLAGQSWEMLEERTGLTRHSCAGDNVRAAVNLALARGMVGRENCGILPIRSASGAPGGEECGAAPDRFPGGFAVTDESARRFSNLWHHPAPSRPGLAAAQMIEAARGGAIKFFYALGAELFD